MSTAVISASTGTVELCREFGITPNRCGHYGCSNSFGSPRPDGDSVIWQCNGCGRYTSRRRPSILARIRRDAALRRTWAA